MPGAARAETAEGQTCSLVSGVDPRQGAVSRQIRLDFPLDNHYYATISNVGDTDCEQYYVRNPLTVPVGAQDFPDYNGGSTNSYGPRVINGKRCILVFTGKRN